MPKKKNYTKNLKLLGSTKTQYFTEPSKDILETFPSPSKNFYTVKFEQHENEFASMCPKTGQGDFATFTIQYTPDKVCIESKSLKMYLQSYRNTAGFGEDLTNKIADDLFNVARPKQLMVKGRFSPRGGITWTTTVIKNNI